jgi:hypothetical protein
VLCCLYCLSREHCYCIMYHTLFHYTFYTFLCFMRCLLLHQTALKKGKLLCIISSPRIASLRPVQQHGFFFNLSTSPSLALLAGLHRCPSVFRRIIGTQAPVNCLTAATVSCFLLFSLVTSLLIYFPSAM